MEKRLVSWLKLRKRVHSDFAELDSDFAIEKAGSNLTPNLRALRLAMTVSDVLLSMGVTANSVVTKALDITEAFCDQPVHIGVTYDTITLSQIRGVDHEPLTLIRPASTRKVNNMTVQAVQQLVYEIRTGKHSLESAETDLNLILSEPIVYPNWLPSLANSLIAPSVALMFTTDWRVIVITFIIAVALDRLMRFLTNHALVPFFQHTIAGVLVTLAAAIMSWLAHSQQIHFFDGLNSTLIVVSGIFMLLSGLTIVGAVQDVIDEYYLTATARLMRVIMLTTGIVMGILIGLYIARQLGMDIAVSPNPLHLTRINYQVVGGAAAAAAFALATQTRMRAVLWAGIVGFLASSIMFLSQRFGISIIPATGVAAAFVGFTASLFSRLWRTPSSGTIAAGIIPLVPGLALYTGLMQLFSYPPGNVHFFRGVGTMFTVVGVALAIASGASFGSILGRPYYRQITRIRNQTPFRKYVRLQLYADIRRAKSRRISQRRRAK